MLGVRFADHNDLSTATGGNTVAIFGSVVVGFAVKTTQYFKHMRQRADRATIRDESIRYVLEHATKTEVQSDACDVLG